MSESPLTGQTALVTGAARRLGREIALGLARNGANVVVHFHTSGADAVSVVEEIGSLGSSAWSLTADLADAAATERLFPQAMELAGPIQILINNASIFPADRVTEFNAADLWHNIQVNAYAPLVLARDFARQGLAGCLINLLDCRITDYDEAHAAYHLSKRMLATLTSMLALEFAPQVRVNGIAPGLLLPPAGKDLSYLEKLSSTNPLQRHGAPADIVAAVDYLVRSDFVTGQILYVDGGRHLRGRVYD
ncbi:MAG: SDR family oxidoreductase [bacterium]